MSSNEVSEQVQVPQTPVETESVAKIAAENETKTAAFDMSKTTVLEYQTEISTEHATAYKSQSSFNSNHKWASDDHQKYAGLNSVQASLDAERIKQMKRGSTFEPCPCYPETQTQFSGDTTAINKGPKEKDLTKMQRLEIKRQIMEAQGSVVFTPAYNPSADIPASGNVSGITHSVDATLVRRSGVGAPYEPFEGIDAPTKRTINQVKAQGWEDSAGKLVKKTIFGDDGERSGAVAPYDSRPAYDSNIVRRVQTLNCETLAENGAGNVRDRCHYMLHERTVSENGIVPYEERSNRGIISNVRENLEQTTEQAAGKVREHFLISDHAKMQNQVAPYSDQGTKASMRMPPQNSTLVDHAGNVGQKGHVMNGSEAYNKVQFSSSISTAPADYEGAAGRKLKTTNIRAEGPQIAPYDPNTPFDPRGVRRMGERSDQKTNVAITEHEEHTKSELRGENTINFAHPIDDTAVFRSGIKLVHQPKAVPTNRVLVGETFTQRNLRRHLPQEPAMNRSQSVRSLRAPGIKRADNGSILEHKTHVRSQKGAPQPPTPRTQKRSFHSSATSGIVPYESGLADVTVRQDCLQKQPTMSTFKHVNTATHHRHHLQSSSMMDVLQPTYAHHQE